MILYFCSGCSYDNDSNQYIVRNINGNNKSADDHYFFDYGGKIYQFSISEQEIIDIINSDDGSYIDDFAVCDEYIFYSSGGMGTGKPGKIWRYDRENRTSELHLETEECVRMIVYDGNLLYGHDNVYVCPIDGNPGEDSVGLMEQFIDTTPPLRRARRFYTRVGGLLGFI